MQLAGLHTVHQLESNSGSLSKLGGNNWTTFRPGLLPTFLTNCTDYSNSKEEYCLVFHIISMTLSNVSSVLLHFGSPSYCCFLSRLKVNIQGQVTEFCKSHSTYYSPGGVDGNKGRNNNKNRNRQSVQSQWAKGYVSVLYLSMTSFVINLYVCSL